MSGIGIDGNLRLFVSGFLTLQGRLRLQMTPVRTKKSELADFAVTENFKECGAFLNLRFLMKNLRVMVIKRMFFCAMAKE